MLRLKECEDESALLSRWNTIIDLVSMTVLDPDVEQVAKDELISNIEVLRNFYAGDDIDEEAAFSWWEQ